MRRLVALALLSANCVAQAPWCWDRSAEWVVQPAAAAGTTQGNPSPDSAGTPTWHYELVTTGGPLGSPDPWYTRPATKLVWDEQWFDSVGGWVVDDDFGSFIGFDGMIDSYGKDGIWYPYKPIVRWNNATTQSFTVSIEGTLTLIWGSTGGGTATAPVDVAIVHRAAATNTYTVHLGTTRTAPTTGPTRIELPVSIPSIAIAPGDDILIAPRIQNPILPAAHFVLLDDLLIIRDGGVAAAETVRAGTPANPIALLPGQTSAPVLGATWDPRVDHATFLPGATLDTLLLTTGTSNLPLPFGTLLLDLSPPVIPVTVAAGAPFAIPIPQDCLLVGATMATQAISTDGTGLALTNAIDVVIGTP